MENKEIIYPQQICFLDFEDRTTYGIQVNEGTIICACCGGIFETNEVKILKVFEDWIDFSEAIKE